MSRRGERTESRRLEAHAAWTPINSAWPAACWPQRPNSSDVLDRLTRLLPSIPRDRVLTVHLDAGGDTICERVHRRGWLGELADDAVEYVAQIDPDLADQSHNAHQPGRYTKPSVITRETTVS